MRRPPARRTIVAVARSWRTMSPMKLRAIAAAGLILALGAALRSQTPTYDVLIRNGRVLDGTGTPAAAVDLAVVGGRIVSVGRIGQPTARRRTDARGLPVTPGFIAVRSHSSQRLAGSFKQGRR